MAGAPQRDVSASSRDTAEESSVPSPNDGTGKAQSSRNLEQDELEAALQLLVERAQYITGATGTALALPQENEMVCRASAGSCSPAVGARLQVRSGLTGESMARRQLLRCDNAEADPRVNIEACRALGIASIVVLPLLRKNGEVRGLFELFSDHAYAFEERDLVALERIADLTITALDLAEQRLGSVPPAPQQKEAERKDAAGPSASDVGSSEPPNPMAATSSADFSSPIVTNLAPAEQLNLASIEEFAAVEEPIVSSEENAAETAVPARIPESMQRVQKCASCGFPVSEGRTYCLDCEKKEARKAAVEAPVSGNTTSNQAVEASDSASSKEELPAFLANAVPVKQSWLADHVNLLAIVVFIVGILVAFVVFHR